MNAFLKQIIDECGGVALILAPLAGITDYPFRRICAQKGAALSYVEMISATALIHNSKRTYEMLLRGEDETRLGIQIVGRAAEEIAQSIEIIDKMPFDTVDINMGCPVAKVVRSGSGSAMLKDPKIVFKTVSLARSATDKPLSVKIRLGWDAASINVLEVADAVEQGGADWLYVHGRTRSDNYSTTVKLNYIKQLKSKLRIPVIANGNVFSKADAAFVKEHTGVDGVLIARGVLGNPWIFQNIKDNLDTVSLDEWCNTLVEHLKLQARTYGDSLASAVCMRKHLIWYTKGWNQASAFRGKFSSAETIDDFFVIIEEFYQFLKQYESFERQIVQEGGVSLESRFST